MPPQVDAAYVPQPGSLLIDHGANLGENPYLQRDIDGDPRTTALGGDGSFDIGAHEYIPMPTLHIGSIAISFLKVGKVYKTVSTAVMVYDGNGLGAAGASVTGRLTGPAQESFPPSLSAVTDAAGKAALVYTTTNSALTPGFYTFCVDNIEKTGSIYDPNQNAPNPPCAEKQLR